MAVLIRSAIFVAALDTPIGSFVKCGFEAPCMLTGYLLFARGNTLTAQSFDARKLNVSGETFPVVEQIGYNRNNSYCHASVSVDGTLAYLSGGVISRQLIWFDPQR
jgi:hypothetical protein